MIETPNIVNDLKQNVAKKVKHFKSEYKEIIEYLLD